MVRVLWTALLALLITVATAWVSPPTDERALYGLEGPVEQNWLPRVVAGWPAPYLADDPDTSVTRKIGAEDSFRPGAFAATLSFWIVVVSIVRNLVAWGMRARAAGRTARPKN